MGLFFVKQKTAYEMRISDWSSDVCSSDLGTDAAVAKWAGDIHATASGKTKKAKEAAVAKAAAKKEAAKPQAKEGKRSEKAAITLDFGATPAMLKAAVPASQTKVADEALAEMLSGGDQSMFDLLTVALPGIALERRAGQPMRQRPSGQSKDEDSKS